jgi:hypothetical protein
MPSFHCLSVVVGPEASLDRLFRRPGGAVDAPQTLDLVQVVGVLLARQRVGTVGRNCKALWSASGFTPGRTQAERRRQRARLPDAGPRRGWAEVGDGRALLEAVVCAPGEHGLSDPVTDHDSALLRTTVRDRSQVGGVVVVQNRLSGQIQAERRLQPDERLVRGGRDRRAGEGRTGAEARALSSRAHHVGGISSGTCGRTLGFAGP